MRREVALMELMEERRLGLRADSANDWPYSGDGGASAASFIVSGGVLKSGRKGNKFTFKPAL